MSSKRGRLMLACEERLKHSGASSQRVAYNAAIMSSDRSKMLKDAMELMQSRVTFEEFLSKLPPKDRVNAAKRVTVLDTSVVPGLGELWRRLVCALTTLAPHAAKLVGKQTVQFYIADGRYRMQVFALEDLQDGNITIYCPDVLTEALEAGLLVRPAAAPPEIFGIAGAGEALHVEALDRDSINPGVHFKDMVGWNRTALRLTLPPTASSEQVAAAETLCAIAAKRFPPQAAASAAVPETKK